MPLDLTVIDDDGNTYVALPCTHCDGDGVTFATVSETLAGLAQFIARRLDTDDTAVADTPAGLLQALAGMGAT